MASPFAQRLRKAFAAVGIGVRSSATEADSSVCYIESGTGAPAHSRAKGSLYLRKDPSKGSERVYVNTDGGSTWINLDAELTASDLGVRSASDTVASGASTAVVSIPGVTSSSVCTADLVTADGTISVVAVTPATDQVTVTFSGALSTGNTISVIAVG